MAPGKANSCKFIWLEDKLLSGDEMFKIQSLLFFCMQNM